MKHFGHDQPTRVQSHRQSFPRPSPPRWFAGSWFCARHFGGGNVCTPAYLYLDDLLIAGGSTLLIKNWIEFTTFLLVKNTSTNVTPELGRIQFEGYGEAATWLPYDSTWSMIAPVPEPSTYGAILLAAGLGLVVYRRRRSAKTAV